MTPRGFYKRRGPGILEGLPGSWQGCRRRMPSALQPAPGLVPAHSRKLAASFLPPSLYATNPQVFRVLSTCCWPYRLSQHGRTLCCSEPHAGSQKSHSQPRGKRISKPCSFKLVFYTSTFQHCMGSSLPILMPRSDAPIICCKSSLQRALLHGWSSQQNSKLRKLC